MSQPHYANVMLADLRVSQWTARKTDKKAAQQVSDANNMEAKAQGAYYKSLVTSDILNEIRTTVSRARDYHYKMTLPWMDSGPRVLPALAYFDYTAKMQELGEQFFSKVNAFLDEYPLEREEARRMLGMLFSEDDYPSTPALADKFAFKVDVFPLPIGADFRCAIGNAEVEDKLRAEITTRTDTALAAATKDVLVRVAKVVDAFIDRLGDPEAKFTSSLVENAQELAAMLPGLNFANDPTLTRLTADLSAKLCSYTAVDLRTNKDARRATYEAALAIRSDMIWGG